MAHRSERPQPEAPPGQTPHQEVERFLVVVRSAGIEVSALDVLRITRAIEGGAGGWSHARLRVTLRSLLARSAEQSARFDELFDSCYPLRAAVDTDDELDLERARALLRSLRDAAEEEVRPPSSLRASTDPGDPRPAPSVPPPSAEVEPAPARRWTAGWVAALGVIAWALWVALSPEPPAPEPPTPQEPSPPLQAQATEAPTPLGQQPPTPQEPSPTLQAQATAAPEPAPPAPVVAADAARPPADSAHPAGSPDAAKGAESASEVDVLSWPPPAAHAVTLKATPTRRAGARSWVRAAGPAVALMSALVLLTYGLYRFRLKRQLVPKVLDPIEVDNSEPGSAVEISLPTGASVPPLLAESALDTLAELCGHAWTLEGAWEIDAEASTRRTSDAGGIPHVVLAPRRVVREVWLISEYDPSEVDLPFVAEVAEGLAQRGIETRRLYADVFSGELYLSDGTPVYGHALEDDLSRRVTLYVAGRRGAPAQASPGTARLFKVLARWPRVAAFHLFPEDNVRGAAPGEGPDLAWWPATSTGLSLAARSLASARVGRPPSRVLDLRSLADVHTAPRLTLGVYFRWVVLASILPGLPRDVLWWAGAKEGFREPRAEVLAVLYALGMATGGSRVVLPQRLREQILMEASTHAPALLARLATQLRVCVDPQARVVSPSGARLTGPALSKKTTLLYLEILAKTAELTSPSWQVHADMANLAAEWDQLSRTRATLTKGEGARLASVMVRIPRDEKSQAWLHTFAPSSAAPDQAGVSAPDPPLLLRPGLRRHLAAASFCVLAAWGSLPGGSLTLTPEAELPWLGAVAIELEEVGAQEDTSSTPGTPAPPSVRTLVEGVWSPHQARTWGELPPSQGQLRLWVDGAEVPVEGGLGRGEELGVKVAAALAPLECGQPTPTGHGSLAIVCDVSKVPGIDPGVAALRLETRPTGASREAQWLYVVGLPAGAQIVTEDQASAESPTLAMATVPSTAGPIKVPLRPGAPVYLGIHDVPANSTPPRGGGPQDPAAPSGYRGWVQLQAGQGMSLSRVEASPCPPGFVFLKGGTFMMGSADGEDDERPPHRVTMTSFCMGRTEVTVAQYRACVEAGGCTAPDTATYCNYGAPGRDTHPINCVDWEQAAAYARWKGAALPTEAQWEYAARGQAGRGYPWGDAPPTCDLAVYSDTPCVNSSTAPVCSRPRGNTPEGLCDMAGNVWEWTADWYDANYYATLKAGATDPTGPAGPLSSRVVRGGSWVYDATWLRGSSRIRGYPSRRISNLGFRVVVPSSPGHAP